MLKNKNFALGTAALLLSTAGFTACSSDDTFTGSSLSGEAVKTQFAINIPVAKSSVNGRLSQEVVQGQTDPIFRGMSKIKLIPFSDSKASLSSATILPANAIVLGDITTNGNADLDNGAKFYEDVAIPVGTSSFLFYGEATPTSGDKTAKTNGAIVAESEFDNGDLANISGGKLENLQFNLQGISDKNDKIETYLSGVLTNIATALADNAEQSADLQLAAENMKQFNVGSSAAILAEVQNIYDMVKSGTPSENTNIVTEIEKYFDTTSGTLTYKTSGIPDLTYEENAEDYPNYLGIPANAAKVSSTDGKKFSYDHQNATDFSTYVYPASLYYFAASDVKTNQSAVNNWNGSSVDDWNSYLSGYTGGTTVNSLTKAIALTSPIHYAVAQLVYNVKFATEELPDAQSVNRAVGTNNFQLTGILIGDQKTVDYQFNQDADATAKTIYDAENATPILSSSAKTFYTLALQSAGGGSESINFSLEFKNNGDAFYGKDGLVPKGGTFYLTGTLTAQSDKAEGYVFKQAYQTIANITINSLKNATYTIPDLRKTQLNLGLYVDLSWQEGLTDNVTIQ